MENFETLDEVLGIKSGKFEIVAAKRKVGMSIYSLLIGKYLENDSRLRDGKVSISSGI